MKIIQCDKCQSTNIFITLRTEQFGQRIDFCKKCKLSFQKFIQEVK